MKPFNILYIVNRLNMGGAEKQLLQLIKGIDRKQFRPFIVCFERGGELIEEVYNLNTPVIFILRRWRWDPTVVSRLLKFIRKQKIQIVHTFLSLASVYGAVASRMAGVPIINSAIRGAQLEKGLYEKILIFISFLFSDHIIANSNAGARFFFRKPNNKLRVVYNGIDLQRFKYNYDVYAKKEELGITAFDKVSTIVARLEPVKDHATFLRAAAIILKQRPNSVFLIVGEGTLLSQLKMVAEEFTIQKNVKFLGWRKDVDAIMAVTDVAILTSVSEGLPNAIIEAQAAGIPVVSTDCGGVSEILRHEISGFITPVGDSEQIAEKVIELFEDPEKAKRMGDVGRKYVEDLFGLESMVSNTERIYKEVLL